MSVLPTDIRTASRAEAYRLRTLYADAERDIKRRLRLAFEKGTSTRHLRELQSQIHDTLAQLDAGASQWASESVPRMYALGVTSVDEALGVTGNMSGIHTQAMQLLADNVYSRLADVQTAVGRRVDDAFRTISLDAVRQTVAGYGTTAQARTDILARLVQSGEGVVRVRPDGSTYLGFQVTPEGKWWDMATYAEMAARTTTMQAELEGTRNRIIENTGGDLAEIVGPTDTVDG